MSSRPTDRSPTRRQLAGGLLALLLAATGCVSGEAPGRSAVEAGEADASSPDTAASRPLPYARRVIDFRPGPGAGHGQDRLPDIVLGPPTSNGVANPSEEVLTLGDGGEIVVGFGEQTIENGPGSDLIVFENPFLIGGSPDQVYAELGEVAVSVDGETWRSFDCQSADNATGEWPGCAGWRPVRGYDPRAVLPLDPAISGGDPFDLEDVGLDRANYVRIRDRSSQEVTGVTVDGFDLDAVGAIHLK